MSTDEAITGEAESQVSRCNVEIFPVKRSNPVDTHVPFGAAQMNESPFNFSTAAHNFFPYD